jgi:hypothetical protein
MLVIPPQCSVFGIRIDAVGTFRPTNLTSFVHDSYLFSSREIHIVLERIYSAEIFITHFVPF